MVYPAVSFRIIDSLRAEDIVRLAAYRNTEEKHTARGEAGTLTAEHGAKQITLLPRGSPRGYRRRLLAMALEDEIPDDDAQR